MRITRDTLMKVVRDTVAQRTRVDRGLISVYLCGSLLDEDYLLGGTTDIDLVFIHTDQVTIEREIIHLTDEIHLDISHHLHRDYRQTRRLRIHPWLGPTLNSCHVLHDPQHLMDFTQASVRGQFDRADFVLERSRSQEEHARQIWVSFHEEHPVPGPKDMLVYLRAVEHAANAIASLTGHPLTERRFLLRFPQRAEAINQPGLYPGLLGLLGAPNVEVEMLKKWIPVWRVAYDALPAQASSRLHPARRGYYQRAMDFILNGSQPMAALWPLLRTWTLAVSLLPPEHPVQAAWQDAMTRLGLLGDGFVERVEAMDRFLDLVEETLEKWGRLNGAFE